MKEIIQGFYQKKHFWTRLILVIAAVILMGFALSWLLLVDLGTDPCTLLNQTISTRLGISIGFAANRQAHKARAGGHGSHPGASN